jgi:NAD(P)-dependent dehydrogenase (short-subunit alcohol dehydrogenase family)
MQEWFAMSIEGKHVILTGGSGGVGRFLTAALAAKGARVAVLDLDNLPQEYANTRLFKCDLADGEAIVRAVKDATKAFGEPTILIHAAAYQPVGPFEELPFDRWRKTFAVGVDAFYHLVKAVLPFMKAKGWGRIVTLTSTTVNEGMFNHCDYVASKAALIGASRVLAREFGQYGITVNCHSLGLTRTPQSTYHVEKLIAAGHPNYFQLDMEQSSIKRVLEPQDHVGPILFLLSDEASMISGQTLIVDGGRIFT